MGSCRAWLFRWWLGTELSPRGAASLPCSLEEQRPSLSLANAAGTGEGHRDVLEPRALGLWAAEGWPCRVSSGGKAARGQGLLSLGQHPGAHGFALLSDCSLQVKVGLLSRIHASNLRVGTGWISPVRGITGNGVSLDCRAARCQSAFPGCSTEVTLRREALRGFFL